MGLCIVMWALYKVYQMIEVAQRSRERRPPPPPPLGLAASIDDTKPPSVMILRKRGWKPSMGLHRRFRHHDDVVRAMKQGKMGASTGIDSQGGALPLPKRPHPYSWRASAAGSERWPGLESDMERGIA